ncbi:hypothetical protein [Geodermatophilus nigrescens]|uniref:Uncharacterized protein n=1 Tax=Geodermatophilus nigrescens TaxID=1070870 RepID=A0A1M5QZB3_9ACTN|nr:hypothetical protein [Geodermatophilus nigrescens]SHH19271.1 hypothetical protein SAMN05444351_4243 [Geodermatophilus nigrescens]
MLIDCDSCTVRGTGCADCVVTVLLGAPPAELGTEPVLLPVPPVPAATTRATDDAAAPLAGVVVDLDDVERRAVRALADGGLVPPLRHRPAGEARPGGRRRTG